MNRPLQVRYTFTGSGGNTEVTDAYLHEWTRDEDGFPCAILEFSDGRVAAVRLHTIKIVTPIVPMAQRNS